MKALIIYHNRHSFPLRKTIEDHIYSFERFSDFQCYFVNAAFRIPKYVKTIPFELVIFHTVFLCDLRWTNLSYGAWFKKYKILTDVSGEKAILPQDEFLCSDRVCRFIKDFKVQHVFPVAPESEWDMIYPGVDREKINFQQVLTGYLDEKTIKLVKKLSSDFSERDIDIGYRAWRAEYWLGRHGLFKTEIADIFKNRGSRYSLKMDISTKSSDTLLGLDWYKFLLRCKYVLGVEGGGSVLDFDGTIRKNVTRYLKKYPQATFEEVENQFFKGKDGKLKLFAISPRHLEACVTKTCQILIEGNYNGILKPGIHYIELKKDYSNLDEVLTLVERGEVRQSIVERAYKDIVLDKRYYYRNFVKIVVEKCFSDQHRYLDSNKGNPYYYTNKYREYLIWGRIVTEVYVKKIIKMLLPKKMVEYLKDLKNTMKH